MLFLCESERKKARKQKFKVREWQMKSIEIKMHIIHLGNSTTLPEAHVFFQLINSGLVISMNISFRRNYKTLLFQLTAKLEPFYQNPKN